MKNLNELEKVIREALPELMELKAGCLFELTFANKVNTICKVISNDDISTITKDTIIWFQHKNNENESRCDFFYKKDIEEKCKIIGQEIQLIHVLKWLLKKEDKNFDFNLHSNSTSLGIGENNPFGICYNWNLDENLLKNQKQVLIDFLFNLIQK